MEGKIGPSLIDSSVPQAVAAFFYPRIARHRWLPSEPVFLISWTVQGWKPMPGIPYLCGYGPIPSSWSIQHRNLVGRSLRWSRASPLPEIADEFTVGSNFGPYCAPWSGLHSYLPYSEKSQLSNMVRPGRGWTMLAKHFVSRCKKQSYAPSTGLSLIPTPGH